jgi:hypothetical protein
VDEPAVRRSRKRSPWPRAVAIILSILTLLVSIFLLFAFLGLTYLVESGKPVEIDRTHTYRFLTISAVLLLTPPIAALVGLVARRPRHWSPWALIGWMVLGYIFSVVLIAFIFFGNLA